MNQNVDIQYNRLNRGINFPCGAHWKKIVFIALLGVSLWVIYIQSLSTTETDTNIYQNICLFYSSAQHYAVKLKPKKTILPLISLTGEDYNKLIDLNDFTFIINEVDKCLNNNVLLLLLVSSAPNHQDLREAIRATWGQEDVKVITIFLLGAVTDDKIQKLIEYESQLYGDIIQGSFTDSYTNLTYKTVMALKYALYHCSNAVYTLKLDDDIFVNLPLMKNYLIHDLSPFGAVNLLQCTVLRNKEPIRVKSSKWYVSEQEYAGSHYPNYCQGPYALLSPDVIFKLYRECQKLPYFFLEDVFTYGFAASKVEGLNHSDIYHYTLGYSLPSELAKGSFDKINFLFGPHSMTVEDIKNFWTYVINRPVRSSIYDNSELSDF